MDFYTDENNVSKFPLLAGEEGFVALGENLDDNGLVNIGMGVRVYGCLDPLLIEKAFQYIIDYNDILRSVFIKENGMRYQRFINNYSFKLDYKEYSSGSSSDNFMSAYNDAYKITQTHINVYDNILWKFKMYKISDNESFLYLVMHHAITDGFSMLLIIKTLSSYYLTLKEGGIPQKSDAGSFVDYMKNEVDFCSSEEGKRQSEYWKNQCKGYNPPDTSFAKGDNNEQYDEKQLVFDKKEMEHYARKCNMSHFSFMLLAFHIAIGRLVKTNDTVISIANANRSDRRFFKTLGKLSRSLVNRLAVNDDETLNDLVKKVNDSVLEGMNHQKACGIYGNIKFNISYSTDMGKKSKSTFAGFDVEPVDFPTPREGIDFIQLLVYDRAPVIRLLFVTNPLKFGKKFIDKCKMYMKQTLFQMFYSSENKPVDILSSPMLDDNEYLVSGKELNMFSDLSVADEEYIELLSEGNIKLYFVDNGEVFDKTSDVSVIFNADNGRLTIDNADRLDSGFYHIVLKVDDSEYLFDSFTIA